MAHPLQFEASTFEEAPILAQCQIREVSLLGCQLPGLDARQMRTDFDLSLASEVRGTVDLTGARIGGNLAALGATLRSESDVLLAQQAEIGGGVFLRNGFSAKGRISFLEAKIAGDVDCSGAKLANEDGDALVAEMADIGGGVFLRNGFTAKGRISLILIKIGGDLDCLFATLDNDKGDALVCESADIRGAVYLDGLSATGRLSFFGAKVGRDLECTGGTLTNDRGYALHCASANIKGNLNLRSGVVGRVRRQFVSKGGVKLDRARVAGALSLLGATIDRSHDPVVLSARGVVVDDALFLQASVIGGEIDLSGARVAALVDDLGQGEDKQGSWIQARLRLDGFSYARFGVTPEAWDAELRARWLALTRDYQRDAWQQLIDVYRATGRQEDMRRAGIAHERDRISRGRLPLQRRIGCRALGAVLGHGYRPARAGLWATALILLFATVVWSTADVFVAQAQVVEQAPQPLVYAADRFIPIIDFGEADRWVPTGWVRWIDWAVVLLGWVLSTLFVARFTRVVRT